MTALPVALSDALLTKFIKEKVWPDFDKEIKRLRGLEAWGRGLQPVPQVKKNRERQSLQEISRTPWMKLMVSTFAQQLIVDGYRNEGSNANAEAWTTWLRNQMPSQQIAINRATLMFGYSYLKVTVGDDPVSGRPMAVMRGASPTKTYALYEDSYSDEWPVYVLERTSDTLFRWWDDDGWSDLEFKEGDWKLLSSGGHAYGHPPFVRYANEIDLEGRCWGEVEPVITLAMRIDKTGFDRLLVQHYNSFKVRYATGLEQADEEEQIAADKLLLSQGEMLVSSNADAKFGVLDETSMDSFIDAYKSDLLSYLSVCQLPLTTAGQIVNVAADALAAGNRPTIQKLHEKQILFGASHNQALRFVNEIEGRADEAVDFDMSVHWMDPEIMSLAQFADAWGKMVDQLGVPKWGVWPKIPGVTQSEVEGWKSDYLSDDKLIKFLREMDEKPAQQGGPNSAQNTPKARNDNGQPKSVGK